MRRRKRISRHQLLFVAAFFAGVLMITIMAKGKTPENTLMDRALSNAFLEQGWNREAFLWQCLWSRGIILLLIMLLTCTSMRVWTLRLVTIWSGVILGILLKLFYLWYGLKGMGLLLTALFPHCLFYWMAYGLVYCEFEKNRVMTKRNLLSVCLATGVVIMGIYIESYVNPFLVNGYIKIFF